MSGQAPVPGWARASGHARLGEPAGDLPPETALDRLLVAECLARYGWAYDERDREALAGCFTEDGVWEGVVMGQQSVGPYQGRDAIADFLAGFWADQADQRRHVLTNVVVEDLDGQRATAHAYLILTSSSAGAMTSVTAGPYRFELAHDDGVWRLSRLVAGFDAPF